jgi:hypothetical protein
MINCIDTSVIHSFRLYWRNCDIFNLFIKSNIILPLLVLLAWELSYHVPFWIWIELDSVVVDEWCVAIISSHSINTNLDSTKKDTINLILIFNIPYNHIFTVLFYNQGIVITTDADTVGFYLLSKKDQYFVQ